MRKSLKDIFEEGKLAQLPSIEQAKEIAKRTGKSSLSNQGYPEEKTGKEKSFTITAENYKDVVTVLIAVRSSFPVSSFPVRVPPTYKV